MTEYITKEQAWEIVKIVARHGGIDSIINADKRLAAIPPADVAPVVHAHWKFYGENGHGYGEWMCTHCRSVTGEKYAKNYCPFCGSRMDGGDQPCK